MKKFFVIILSVLIMSFVSPALAADGQTKLPTRWNYATEWLNLNLFTWKAESKVILTNRYATNRANEIKTVVNQNNSSVLTDLISRYSGLITKTSQIIQKNKNNSSSLVDTAKSDLISQQKTLSEARQSALVEDDQKKIAAVQESAVNKIKQNIADMESSEAATSFADQVVTVWRDPKNTITDEKETRVYAVGTSESGTIDDGVIIDGGEAKISNDSGGNLKIEYAPGTGPNSVVGEDGKKVWKIQMSDGSIVESYTAGSNVVIGKSSGTASNIVVNTVSGGTTGTANVVVGNTSGSANTVVVGGKSVVTSGDTTNSTSTGNTVNNSTTGQIIQTTP